jgi:putative ABC transport system ATP-binding protein
MIRLNDLSVTFNKGTALEKPVLQGLNLILQPGDFVTVIGSNGAGKSTLLNAIAGVVQPDRGIIEIDGDDVTRWPIWKRAELVGQVCQDPRLGSYEDMTIAENMAIAARRGASRGLQLALTENERAVFAEALKVLHLGLEDRMDTLVGLLSGGQRQALSLIMTTLRPMKVLLLDEHTSALDPRMADIIIHITDEIVSAHKLTAMMVTHSMQQALNHGTRTLMLHEGQVLFDVSGDERASLTMADLLAKFRTAAEGEMNEDRLLLG